MMKLIRLLKSEGRDITFASPAAKSEFVADLDHLGIARREIQVNNSEFDDFIRDLQPSIVLFDRFVMEEQFGWRVAEQCPEALRILDTEDLHCLRRTRQKAVDGNRPFKTGDLLDEEIAKREVASILRSDLSLIISEYEMDLLKGQFKIDKMLLHYLPFMEKEVSKTAAENRPAFSDRKHFITIGNFSHNPNLDSVTYLKQEIWPLIQPKLPEAEMHIYGAYPSQRVRQLHDPETNFLIKGRADSAESVVRKARVMLAPLRFGAGLKGKLLEAMRCGTPSVTTDIGAEGMQHGDKWSGFIANRPDELAARAIQLYTDEEKWSKAVRSGDTIINEKFAVEKHSSGLISKISALQENLREHRKNNFAGSMLMHHTMASSRYMSRWIEEKNKN